MIEITAKQDGFRRCGVAHSKKPTRYPDDRWSDEQLMALADEPMLIVVSLPDETQGGGAPVVPEPSTPSTPAPPGPMTREEKLIAACRQLDPDRSNTTHWTRSGLPQTEALEELAGEPRVSAAERDQAWESYQEQVAEEA